MKKANRNSQGQFVKQDEEEINESTGLDFIQSEIKLKMPTLSIMNILKIIFFIFLFSPWIYICYRRGVVRYLKEGVSTFYESTFPTSDAPGIPTEEVKSTKEKNGL